ncbi:unnamed protein product [Arabidopsis arenosa]|uniref:Uncharacterized protein n=1 Tax=Arabidopsis arenosa TaxID=38785 RepID=A0A8S2A7H1_ARAAE|nr:unnamed protein product [Arabidopsis arenosa]
MATLRIGSALIYQNILTHHIRLRRPHRFVCKSMTKTTPDATSADLRRRSGNYQPSPWDHCYLLSIENKYASEKEVINRDVLKEKVKMMFDVEKKSRLEQLELIDDLQKLGVSYHFELDINDTLTDFHLKNERNVWKCDKEEDLHAISLEFRLLRQHGFDVSENIFDVIIDKIESNTFKSNGIKGIIYLYEASFLSKKSDTKLHKVIRPFATEQIRKFVEDETNNIEEREKAIHALEMPYHWRMRRLETRWYIDAYKKTQDMNLVLVEFAKIDFNIVQAAHQEDLKYVSSWDVNRLGELPEYMRLCFLILYNETNGIGCDILKYKKIDVIPLLKKSTLCQHPQHIVRCSATVLRLANDLGTSSSELARGDVLKSVQCYMHETGASEKTARDHVQQMISDTWDDMNYETKTARSSSLLSRGFVEAAMNLARMSQCMYQYGDGHGCPDKAKTVDRVQSLLVDPIPLN